MAAPPVRIWRGRRSCVPPLPDELDDGKPKRHDPREATALTRGGYECHTARIRNGQGGRSRHPKTVGGRKHKEAVRPRPQVKALSLPAWDGDPSSQFQSYRSLPPGSQRTVLRPRL